MIPASFDYLRADSVDEAVAALKEHGEDAKLLAGGHSLLPLMRLRLAAPSVLVDIGRVEGLRGVSANGVLTIGALTTHDALATDPLVRSHCGVLADVAETIGDPQVRHRGTIGGSIAHGDAAGDLPAVMLALGATMVAQGPAGRREIAASDFFVDFLTTALAPDEVLVEVRVPMLDASWGWDYQKFTRAAQGWAMVGVLALVKRGAGGIEEARVALTNMATVPLRAGGVEAALASGASIEDACASAAEGTRPSTDLHASAEFRRHLVGVLARRALAAASA
jgi:carbon-monoxide dehydrogenase medium subunit